MVQVIKISDELYNRLAALAEGFDNPENVIEKLANHYEGIEDVSSESDASSPKVLKIKRSANFSGGRDTTKYIFKGSRYGKGRLVLAVIQDYVENHPEVTFDDLLEIFPRRIQGSGGVFGKVDEAMELVARTGHKRHFLKDNEVVDLADSQVAVSTEWGIGNIDNFLIEACNQGFEIVATS